MESDTDDELDLRDIVDNFSIFLNESEGSDDGIFDNEDQTVLTLRVPSDDFSDDMIQAIFAGTLQPTAGSTDQDSGNDDAGPNLSGFAASIQKQSRPEFNSPEIRAEMAEQIRDIVIPLAPQLRPESDDMLLGMFRDYVLRSRSPKNPQKTKPEEPKRKYRNRPTGLIYNKKNKKPVTQKRRKKKSKTEDVSNHYFHSVIRFKNVYNYLVLISFHSALPEQDWITKEVKRHGRRDPDGDGGTGGASMCAC
jgi:hypothetical protein